MELFFKKGDPVSHQAHGNGVVKSADNVSVLVEFNEYYTNTAVGRIIRFQTDGRSAIDDKYPTLLQGHDRFIKEPNKPIFEPKEGDLVWAKFDSNWFVGYFVEFDQFNIPLIGIRKGAASCHATEIRLFKGEAPKD